MSQQETKLASLIADIRTGLFWAATSTMAAALLGSALLAPR